MKKLGIQLMMNNACDKQCAYCYEYNAGDEFLTEDAIRNIISKMAEMPFFNNAVTFFGGEPTISMEVIKNIMSEFPTIDYTIITNGYFIKLDKISIECMKNMREIAVSVECTEHAHTILRGGEYNELIKKLIGLNKEWNNICLNVSINRYMYDEMDEFIENYHKWKNAGLGVHLYAIKGNDLFINAKEYGEFLIKMYEKDRDIFNQIILSESEDTDCEFLCSFEDKIVVDVDNTIIKCARLKERTGSVVSDATEWYNNWVKSILGNSVELYERCKSCPVELGKCQVSCPAFIAECIKDGEIDLLNRLCDQEEIKQGMREMLKESGI